MTRSSLIKKYRTKYEKAKTETDKAGIDFEQYLDYLPKPGKTAKVTDKELEQYLGTLEKVIAPKGTDIIKYKGYAVPRFYRDLYKESLREYNKQSSFLRKVGIQKFKEPSEEFATFLEYAPKVIERATFAYQRYREEIYKQNYLKGVKDTLSHTTAGRELYSKIKKVSAGEMLRIYHLKGNEDLGIINLYPGDEEQAELQAEYLLERWDEVLSG